MERAPKIGKGHGFQAHAPQTHHTGSDDPDATAGLTRGGAETPDP